MVEGGSSKHFSKIKRLAFSQPKVILYLLPFSVLEPNKFHDDCIPAGIILAIFVSVGCHFDLGLFLK